MTKSVETPKIPPLPDPREVSLVRVRFKVLTEETLPRERGWVYMALTPEQYQNLSRNNAEILRWMQESKARLKYYRKRNE